MYVVDDGNARVQKFDSNGKFLMAIGNRGNGDGQLDLPVAVAVNGQGFIFVADASWNYTRIQKFDSSGKFVSKFGEGGSGDGQLFYPSYMIVDAQSNLYVTDPDLGRVQEFTSDGKFLAKWDHCGTTPIITAWGVAIDKAGNLYIADADPGKNMSSNPTIANSGNRVCKFDNQGQFLFAWGGRGSSDGQLLRPMGIAVDDTGNVYVSEAGNLRIQKFRQK